MRRYAPFIALSIVTLCIAAAALAYFLPSLSLSLVPGEIRQPVADSLECGDGTCTAINVRARQAPVDAADQSNGIEARWCVAYLRVEQNTGSLTREYLPWAYQTAKSYRFVLEKTHGSYEPISFSRSSDGDPERYELYCR
ncbi:MAG TPA: hypothetical protein VFO07_09070 [Roseiflexaceae bacterium]|nr:hypothetical protein [Roseiflexaceae bacterium]